MRIAAERRLSEVRPELSAAPAKERAAVDLVGASAAIRRLRKLLEQVARTRATVLLVGETGTGKGHAARHLHRVSREHDQPFVHVDCASLSPSVIESELFGHERGAFTGAHERRIGRFERAGEGTIFLDEIAELAPELQAKLLRVLQEREFERVGGATPLPVRARVVAATNRDLRAEIRARRFRADLFYRLQVCELRLPALRERIEDLPALLAFALDRVAPERAAGDRAETRSPPFLSDGFVARLAGHDWPGNVRELQNLVERLAISNPAGPWTAFDVDAVLAAGTNDATAVADAPDTSLPPGSRRRFEAAEREELAQALRRHRWNVSAAARSLGLSRGTLRGRMARLGLA